VRYVLAFALACGVVIATPRLVVAASEPVQVRVYDAAVMPAANQTVALRAAAGVLAAAGIDVTWTLCNNETSGRSPVCDTPVGRAELSVRFVRLAASVAAGGQLQLGYALVDTTAGEGQLATVFVDRVDWLASEAGAEAPVVLGFAVAHEIGHLLLGTNAHAPSGLMRALWTRSELAHAKMSNWLFSPQESDRMRTSLAERKGLRSSHRDATGCSPAHDGNPDASTGCGGAPAPVASLRGVAAGPD